MTFEPYRSYGGSVTAIGFKGQRNNNRGAGGGRRPGFEASASVTAIGFKGQRNNNRGAGGGRRPGFEATQTYFPFPTKIRLVHETTGIQYTLQCTRVKVQRLTALQRNAHVRINRFALRAVALSAVHGAGPSIYYRSRVSLASELEASYPRAGDRRKLGPVNDKRYVLLERCQLHRPL